MKFSHLLTVLAGVFLIALIAPLTQFLTIMTVNLDLETATPVGWAVGIVFSLVVVVAVLRFLRRIVDKHSLVILYCMLTISVPVMNIGMVRQCFLAMNAVMREYMHFGTSTYRTAYNVLNEDWFPLVPTKKGLAWNRGDRLLSLLRQEEIAKQQKEARRKVTAALLLESQRLRALARAKQARESGRPPQEDIDELRDMARDIPLEEVRQLVARATPEAMESLSLKDVLEDRLGRTIAPATRPAPPTQPTSTAQPARGPPATQPGTTTASTRTTTAPQTAPTTQKLPIEQLSEPAARLVRALRNEAERLGALRAGRTARRNELTAEELSKLREQIRLMGVDQLEDVRDTVVSLKRRNADALGYDKVEEVPEPFTINPLASLGMQELFAEQLEQARQASRRAAEELPEKLAGVDEFAASLLPANYEDFSPDGRDRIEKAMERLSEQRRKELLEDKAWLEARADKLRSMVTALSTSDYRAVVDALAQRYLQRYREMGDDEFDRIRNSFVYRLTRQERQSILQQSGEGGKPGQNLAAFRSSLWRSLEAKNRKQELGWRQNVSKLFDELPWHLWVRPLIMWGLLFTSIFLFLMCVAEWLRRKWIERENLAFPLVDVADGIIRHDWAVERGVDPREPPKRNVAFNSFFLLGIAVGIVWLTAEAAGHYTFASKEYITAYNVSEKAFKTGALKEMDKVQFVLSPIVIGIAFLVSLEISFSVWSLFFIYSAIALVGKLASTTVPQDSVYTGWAGGRFYPFPMEQMLGAVVAFAGVSLYKSLRAGGRAAQVAQAEYFIPPRINRIGLIVLPIAVLLLLWDMGFSPANTWFLALVALLVMAQTIAGARVRAETGLPTHHTSYEYTKFPMVFGMTGATGAKCYALFANLVFLPVTLLFRSLPQHLENIELARRNKLKYKTIAVAVLVAFLVALTVGMVSFLAFSHYYGYAFYGGADKGGTFDDQGPTDSQGLAHYPLWVSHFLGETGLGEFTQPHWIRIEFMVIGAGALLLLTYLRNRFLRFPFHPLGYMLLMLAVYYQWVSPYYKGASGVATETTWIWGSVLVAWAIKKMVVKYGGMFSYKRAKPFFIGLVVGAVLCVFIWNCMDLVASIVAETSSEDPGRFMKPFLERPPYSPGVY